MTRRRKNDEPALADPVDRAVLALVRAEGRITLNEIGHRTGISRVSAHARFERLCRDGVITGFEAVVDPTKIGLPVTALVLLTLEQRRASEVRDAIAAIRGVEWCAFTGGPFDMLVLVRLPDVASLRDVVLGQIQSVRHVKSSQTAFILDEERFDWTRAVTGPTTRDHVGVGGAPRLRH